MTSFYVTPSMLKGKISVPSSKSQTLRAMLFASLAEGKSVLYNPLKSPDTEALIHICRSLDARIDDQGKALLIEGNGGSLPQKPLSFDAGNSGILLRFLTALAAVSDQPITLTGDSSVCQRPMQDLVQAYQAAGVNVLYDQNPGFAPLTLRGPINEKGVEVKGDDSQPVSALLIAGSLLSYPLQILVREPGEKPWVDITVQWLQRLGVSVDREGYHRYLVKANGGWKGFSYQIPGDWSSAAFPLAAAYVTKSSLSIVNLDEHDDQGDRRIVSILESFKNLNGGKIECDINDCIDVLPILCVLACCTPGVVRIKNAKVARTKECDRIRCMCAELKKMGADINEFQDGLEIKGGGLKGAHLKSYGDHRIAMALTVAALGAASPSTIDDVACIKKTYPNFFDDFTSCGANIERIK